MSNELKHLMKGNANFHERPEPLTAAERKKAQSLSADIETATNKKLLVRCLLIAALLMCFMQSGLIVKTVEKLSPNLVSDSAKKITKEWHKGMDSIGVSGLSGKISSQVQNIFPALNPRNQKQVLKVHDEGGSSIALRGPTRIGSEITSPSLEEKEPRTKTHFGKYKFRGSL